jgi:hypothetical protein
MKKRFNLGQAITFSFQSLRRYPLLIMVPVGIQTTASIMFSAGIDLFTKLSKTKSSLELTNPGFILLMSLGFLVLFVIYFLVLTITQISLIRVGFKIYQKEEDPGWKKLFYIDWPLIRKCLLCDLLIGLFVILGLIVCFIPGLILYFVLAKHMFAFKFLLIIVCMFSFIVLLFFIMINYLFITSIAVDTRDSVNEIFQKSKILTKGIKWSIFGYLFLMFILPYPITRSIMPLSKLGLVWQYYSLYGIFTFLWTSLVAMIPVYLYKDLMRQQTQLEVGDIQGTIGEDLAQELEEEQAEELVEESPEL